MLARFARPAATKAFRPAPALLRVAQHARNMATVGSVEGSVGRKMPATRPRATPISHDRATFTIRV